MLGNTEKKTILSIGRGKIIHYKRGADPDEYTFIEGRFEGITTRTRKINGVDMPAIDFNFSDGSEQYVLSVITMSVATDIIRCLYGIQDFRSGRLRIDTRPRQKNDTVFTNVYVSFNGKDYRWAVDIPAPQEITLPSGKVVTDDGITRDAIQRLIEEINSRCFSPAPAQQPAEPYVEDLPPGDESNGGYNPYGGFSGPSDF